MPPTSLVVLTVAFLWPVPAAGQSAQIIEYYHTDTLGSVRAVTKLVSGQVQVVSRHDFMPFGEEVNAPNPPTEKRLFTGKERDNESGLDYFGARYLASDVGRFTSPDSVFADTWREDSQRWNLYAYGRNNPLKFNDPTGRKIYVGGLNQQEQGALVDQLSDFYGCSGCVTVDKNGYLRLDASQLTAGVVVAAQYLTHAIDSEQWFAVVHASNNDSSFAFAKAAWPMSTHTPFQGNMVRAYMISLDFADLSKLGGNAQARRAFTASLLPHEVAHLFPTYVSESTSATQPGAGVVGNTVNGVTDARGMARRVSNSYAVGDLRFIDFLVRTQGRDKVERVMWDRRNTGGMN